MEMQALSLNQKNPYQHFSEEFKLQIYSVFKKLKALGCDYFYFLGTDGEIRYRFSSQEEWMEIYYSEKFILNDPLKRIAEKSSWIVFPWNQVTHQNSHEKKTMQGRVSYGFYNGLTISRKHLSRQFIFTFATAIREHDLARYLLLEKNKKLEDVIQYCMQLFNQYLHLMHQSISISRIIN